MSGALKSYLAEFIGTFAWIFVGAGSICVDAFTGGKVGPLGIALAHGAIVAIMTTTYGPVSGGHFNPAVSLAMLAARRLSPVRCVFYVASQLLGSVTAAVLLAAAFHSHPEIMESAPFLGACDLAYVGFNAGTLLEAVAAFFLVSAVYATTLDERGQAGAAPLAVGLAVAAGVLVLGPMTGAALNPARAFGPAVVTGYWANWYIYWIGPLAGAIAAGQLQEHFFLREKNK